MLKNINLLVTFVFTIMIITPFVNGALTSRFDFNLNIFFPLFFLMAVFRSFLIRKQLNIKNVIIWVILAGLLCFTTAVSISLSPPKNEVIDIQILSIICGVLCALPLLDAGLVEEITKQAPKLFIISCSIALAISLGSLELVEIGIQNSTRSIYFSSPISIAIIAGIAVISILHARINFPFKILFVFLMLFAMYIMSSRGPIIALLFCVMLYIFKKYPLWIKITISTLFVIVIPLILNIRGTVSESNSEREMILNAAAELFANDPFGGYLGRFNTETGLIYTHNLFIDFAIDLGILQALWLLFIVTSILLGFFRVRNNKGELFVIYLFLYLLFCMFFSLPAIEMLKIFIPLAFAALAKLSGITANNRVRV